MKRLLIAIFLITCAIPLSGMDTKKEGWTPPLILLIQNNASLQAITNFIKKHPESVSEPKIDHDGINGGFPLQHACFSGRKDIIAFLLSIGADPNCIDASDKTPIHFAVVTTDQKTIRLLIKHGADINHRAYGRNLPVLDIFAAAGFEDTHQDKVMEENLRFILPISALTEDDVLATIDYTRCIQGIASLEVMESHLRKLRIVQQFLAASGKGSATLNEFLAAFPKNEKKDN